MKLKNYIVVLAIGFTGANLATSCNDMLDYDDGAHVADVQISDTATYVLGIIAKMQALGVRTNILGEVRGDLVQVLSTATSDMKNIANFNFSDKTALNNNRFNQPSDYYAVINDCNTFISKVDLNAKTSSGDEYMFTREYAAIKFYRAWTYLQLAINYGENIPFITKPALTVSEALENSESKNMLEIINWLIENDDLEECRNVLLTEHYPFYGMSKFIGSCANEHLFFPGDVVLGDLYLWRSVLMKSQSDALQAAKYYYHFLANRNPNSIGMLYTGNNKTNWLFTSGASYNPDNKTYTPWGEQTYGSMTGDQSSYDYIRHNGEVITVLLMDTASSEGNYNMLNKYYTYSYEAEYEPACIVPSNRLKELSDTMLYCGGRGGVNLNDVNNPIYSRDESGKETIVYGDDNRSEHETGDLRYAIYINDRGGTVEDERVSFLTNSKHTSTSSKHVTVYRKAEVFLKLAEAMNYAGYPMYADALLSFGINDESLRAWVFPNLPESGVQDSTLLIKNFSWNANLYPATLRMGRLRSASSPATIYADTMRVMPDDNITDGKASSIGVNIGIHSRGSGSTQFNKRYYEVTSLEEMKELPEFPEDKKVDGKIVKTAPRTPTRDDGSYIYEEPTAPVIPEPGIDPDDAVWLLPFNPAHPVEEATMSNYTETDNTDLYDKVCSEDECREKWTEYYQAVKDNLGTAARRLNVLQQVNARMNGFADTDRYLQRQELESQETATDETLFAFNPKNANPTAENYTETAEATIHNVYSLEEAKEKWLEYCRLVFPDVTEDNEEFQKKWMAVLNNPYLIVDGLVNKTVYTNAWSEYVSMNESYEDDLDRWSRYINERNGYDAYVEYLMKDMPKWRHEARELSFNEDQRKVAKMVLDEQAIEFAYEGKRFYDLMRYAYWKGNGYGSADTQVLKDAIETRNNYKYPYYEGANPISGASGVVGDLSNEKNWFLRFWPSDEVGIGPK